MKLAMLRSQYWERLTRIPAVVSMFLDNGLRLFCYINFQSK